MSHAMRLRCFSLVACAVTFAACGGDGSSTKHDSGIRADADAGFCGTHENPGVLVPTELSPALGATVVNQSIVHSFTIVNAPAEFNSFKIVREDANTAGVSTPFDLQFQMTKVGSNLFYKMVVDSWSIAPGHVELRAGGSFDTKNGCTWIFPTPLFSYNITPAPIPDGGTLDTAQPIDNAMDVPSPTDAPGLDGPGMIDGSNVIDTAIELDTPAGIDGVALDVGSSLD
jgi:hypothetical protein